MTTAGQLTRISSVFVLAALVALAAAHAEDLAPPTPVAQGHRQRSPLPAPLPTTGAKLRSPSAAAGPEAAVLPQPRRLDDKRVKQMMAAPVSGQKPPRPPRQN